MPEADSIPILSNPSGRYSQMAPQPAQKPKILGRLREALRLEEEMELLRGSQPLRLGWRSWVQPGLRKGPSSAEFRIEKVGAQ